MNHIVSDNENIIGCFEEKINAIIYLLDCIINKFKFYLDFLKLNNKNIISPKLNSFKLTSIINNSTIIRTIDVFDINKLKLINIMTEENEFISSNSENIILSYKSNILKNLIHQIDEIKGNPELNIFIPNDMLNSDVINDMIINSPESSEFNCIDNNINIEEIKEKIQRLSLQKKTQEEIIKNVNQERIKKLNNERETKKTKEKIDEYKRRFKADISVYLKIKDDIENNDQEIPELFINQYPILKVLDNLNLLDNPKGFIFYYDKIKQINEIQCQNTVYSNIFNDGSVFYTKKTTEFSDSSEDLSNEYSDNNIHSDNI
jgi:hypothetical protein